MSEIREKLATMLHATACREYPRCHDVDPLQFKQADAILGKFEVTEKKPRYTITVGCYGEWAVNENGRNVCLFKPYECQRAREYCDWLNSKESK